VEVSRAADTCRRIDRLRDDVLRHGHPAARRLIVECARLFRLSRREREVVRSRGFPADELPPGLRELLMRHHVDLDQVRIRDGWVEVVPNVQVAGVNRYRAVPAPRTRRLGESVVVPVPAPRTRRLGES